MARVSGEAGHDIVRHGLTALVRLAHRGAPASLGAVDGCGLLTAIPWALLVQSQRAPLPGGRTRALGMLFIHPTDADRAKTIVERELGQLGAAWGWRSVPIDRAAVLPAQRASTPRALQVIIGLPDARHRAEERLFRARLRIESAALAAGIRLNVVSLSTRTVVYKALTTPEALPVFYPDLGDEAFTSRFAVFHQRFSTNTSADWALAQPFRLLAHNGEINTIAGNREWMRARLLDESSVPGFAAAEPIARGGSDSRSLDDAVELLRHRGYPVEHALSRLMPPAWDRDRSLPPDVRAFHEFQAMLSEPWDGPSALAFADGRFVGAALDRNGFRPARVVRTADNLIAVASETGVLAAAEHDIIERDRLGPGDMVLVDLERGTVTRTNDIHRRLAFRRRYRQIVADTRRTLPQALDLERLETLTDPNRCGTSPGAAAVNVLSRVHGVNREEIEVLIKPMIADAHEAVGSMGDDTPPAVLSSRSRLFTDLFRQRFAQVTNPPIDPYRESSVMSLTTWLGAHGNYLDETAPRPPRVVLRSPILTPTQLLQIEASILSPATIAMTFAVGDGSAFAARVEAIAQEACAAVRNGAAVLVLSHRDVSIARAPMPSLLATSAVHQALITAGLRMRASLVVDAGDARDAHQIAALCAFGAAAVCPTLGYAIVADVSAADETGCQRPAARYRLALERGLLTILSKMGVCTFQSYCGSRLFEILGLDRDLADRYFPGTPIHAGAIGLASLAESALRRHADAFGGSTAALGYAGLHGYRRDGEYHATNPLVVRGLQKSIEPITAKAGSAARMARASSAAYDTFKSHVHDRPPSAVRDLLAFVPAAARTGIHHIESVDDICRRFFASAMSVGALSPEAHRTIARAMNLIGARSNSGEGGEETDRFGRSDGNRTRQVASARFGVTPAYLRSADELQIKIAQGSKPGEGGQLPALKVVPHIARMRHAQPGQTLISPPVHHDIYSIEDLAELLYDLRAFHPTARLNVKLVASSGVGIIAAGVAKAGAEAIQISGHDGGTGASPRGSIKHAGLPWEIGLADAHQALVASGLRHRVVLQTDGGLKTGRDIAMAAALGADEYGFGTAALIAIGCVMARQCHANTCPVGIATQRDDLRVAFSGTPDMLIAYLRLVAGEVREILAALGLRTVDELIGRGDLLRARPEITPALDVERLLRPYADSRLARTGYRARISAPRASALEPADLQLPIVRTAAIANTDRACGADIAGAIAARYGDAGVADGSIALTMTGSAGQSFGAFALPGMRLTLIGDANDGLGKGMHGGRIVVAAAARERGRHDQVLAGNAALYGATGGRVFIGGRAGERFAVRNSGATAVVEGVGDHACEYMTAGAVVILGSLGRNFASGMTGGVAYVCDRKHALITQLDPQHLRVEPLTAADHQTVVELLETHERLTGSRLARAILRHDRGLTTFKRVMSAAARPAGASTAVAEIEPLEPVARELSA